MTSSEIIGLISDVASVVGVATAVVVALLAKSDAKASNAEAARSREIAQDARDAQLRMADALERMTSGHAPSSSEALGPNEKPGPEVEFLIERRGKNQLALRNLGPETATGVTIPDAGGAIARNLPAGSTLEPFQSHEFLILGSFQAPTPAEVKVISDQRPEGVWVRIPRI